MDSPPQWTTGGSLVLTQFWSLELPFEVGDRDAFYEGPLR